MDNPEFWDEEAATEMLDPLHEALAKAERRPEFELLVGHMREQWPDVYRQIEHWVVPWLAEDALVAGARDSLRAHVGRMADLAEKQIDIVSRFIAQLRWHGDLDLLVALRERAWPTVRSSSDILSYAVDEFAHHGSKEIVFRALDRGEPVDDTSEAMTRVRAFFEEEPGPAFAARAATLAGTAKYLWTMQDLMLPAVAQRSDDEDSGSGETPAFEHVRDMLDQFRAYVRVKWDVPWSRADMMASEIGAYLFRRAKGRLGPRLSMLERVVNKAKPPRPFPPPEHVLCPDAKTLDMFVGRYFSIFGSCPYQAKSLVEGLPLWLGFLRERGLVDDTRHGGGMAALVETRRACVRLFEGMTDPALHGSASVLTEKLAPRSGS